MINSGLYPASSQTAAPACLACAYPPSKLADDLGTAIILTPSAREVPITWHRTLHPEVPVFRLGVH